MQALSRNRLNAALTILVWVSACIFVIAAIVPGRPFLLNPRKLLYVCLTLLVAKSFYDFRNGRHGFLEIFPFLILFLLSTFSFSRFQEYRFGADDAYYYSYVRSIWIDGDLDLQNEYELSGLARFQDQQTREARTSTGYSPNVFPVGLSIFWTPFFLLGHVLALIFHLPADGFSRVYTHSVAVGNLLYACAGLYVCYRFCASFFSKPLSVLMTAFGLFTAPHLLLFFRSFLLISEPLSLSLVAFLFFCTYRMRNETSRWKWFLLGILLGAMTMVRFHNGVAGIVPVVILIFQWRKKRSTRMQFVMQLGCLFFGTLLGFIPQMIVWRILYGSWLVNLGSDFLPFWKGPFILETLFSARKGLFPWSPAAFIAICGLPFLLKKDRMWGVALLLVLAATIWMNSAQADWWGATSLGSRRFLPIASIFVVGLACLYSLLPRMVRAFMVLLLISLVWLNFHFVNSFRSGQLQADHADRFSDVLQGPYVAYRSIVYALQFPVHLAYRLNHGIPMYGSLSEFFIGEDVFYFQERAKESVLSENSPLFGEGWSVTDGIRQTSGPVSFIRVPLFMKEKPRLIVEMKILPVNAEKTLRVDFFWNGEFLRSRKVSPEGTELIVPVGARRYEKGMNSLTMQLESFDPDQRIHLVLERIHFRRALRPEPDEEESL
jgi:hypothetical protein